MFTIMVEDQAGFLVDLKFGARSSNYAEHRDLARGLSAGIDRPGITPSELQTVAGPRQPRAVLLVDEYGNTMHRFIDCADVPMEEVLYRHKDGLVWFTGSL